MLLEDLRDLRGLFWTIVGDFAFELTTLYGCRMQPRVDGHLSRDDPLVLDRARNINRNDRAIKQKEKTAIKKMVVLITKCS